MLISLICCVLQKAKSRPSLPALATVRQGYEKINANFLLGALIFSLRVTFGVCHLFLGCKGAPLLVVSE